MRRSWKGSSGVVAVYVTLGALVAGLGFASPALAAAPETPDTNAATAVTGTSAIFNGTLNPGAEGEAGYFFTYNTGGTCEGGPSTEPGAEQKGKAVKVSTPVTKLEAKTKYTFCVVATHEGESTAGGPLSFTTGASAPVVENGEVNANTPFSATGFAFVDPENEPTACIFEYGETPALGTIATCEPHLLDEAGPQGVSINIGGLEPGKTYHYRWVAENGTGQTEGTEGEFATPALQPPVIEEESTPNITSEGATLHAQINPNYQETKYHFEYATNEAFTGAKVTPEGGLPSASTGEPANATIEGLQPRTTYFFRVIAENTSGTQQGSPVEFETRGTPIVTTGEAEQITRTTATVSGTVDPGGDTTLVQVAYINQEDYEAVEEGVANPVMSEEGGHLTSGVTLSAADFVANGTGPLELRELEAGTTYHYAIVATNAAGTTVGPEETFTTAPATPPIVTTGGAVGVTQTTATLTGTVDTRGLQTMISFEYGTSPSLGSSESATLVPNYEVGTTVAVTLSIGPDLAPGTTFYYRVRASNADGEVPGEVRAFTTATFPMPPTYSAPTFPVLPIPKVPPAQKTSSPKHKKKSASSKKLAKALKACAKKPKSKRAACKRQARKKYGKKG